MNNIFFVKKVEHWDSQHDKDKAALTVAWQSSNSYYKVVGRLLFYYLFFLHI